MAKVWLEGLHIIMEGVAPAAIVFQPQTKNNDAVHFYSRETKKMAGCAWRWRAA
jgi:hypothetical protein